MIKRMIAAVLCILLCCSTMNVWAAEEENTEENPYQEAVNLLGAIGVFDPGQVEAFDPWSAMTRAEFIAQLMKVMNSGVSPDGYHYFSDIADNPYASEINRACMLGIAQGYDNQEFRPDDAVLYIEAIVFTIRALGYETYAGYKGGYPYGYIEAANKEKLLLGISNFNLQEEMERGAGAQLMVNALDAEPLTMQSGSGSDFIYGPSKGDTLLWSTRKIRSDEGYVTATAFTRLATAAGAGKGSIEIDNSVYGIDPQRDMTPFLGSCVNYYYKDDGDAREIVYISESSKNKSVIIPAEDILSVDNNILYYSKEGGGREYREALSASLCVIYNGKAAPKFTIPKSGQIKLVDNDSKKGYDIAIITDYKNYVVAATDAEDKCVYDLYDNSSIISFDEGEKDFVSLKTTDGMDINFDAIGKHDVISAAQSEDGKIVSAFVSSKRIEGKVSKISLGENGDYAQVTVEGTIYRTVRDKKVIDLLEPGMDGIFCLDMNGWISAVLSAEQPLKYGYLINVTETLDVESGYLCKILTQNDGVETFPAAEKLRVDEKRVKEGEMPAQIIEGGQCVQQLILYRLNEDDELIEIQTASKPVQYDQNGLRALSARGSMRYYGQTATLAGRFMVSTNTIVFVVPETAEGADRRDYVVRSSSHFKVQGTYDVQPFVATANACVAEAVVVREKTSPSIVNGSPIVCISEMETVVDEDNAIQGKLYGYNHLGEPVNYTTESVEVINSKDLKVGDIVKIVQNVRGNVTDISKMVDADNPVLDTTYANQGDYGHSMRIIQGRAISKNDMLVGCSTSNDPISDNMVIDEYVPMDKAVVLVCESGNSGNTLRTGSINDVYDYRSYGGEYSTFVSCLATTVPRLVVVYRQ